MVYFQVERFMRYSLFAVLVATTAVVVAQQPATPQAGIRFQVTMAPGLLPVPRDGRLLLALSRAPLVEPRFVAFEAEAEGTALVGIDVKGCGDQTTAIVDDRVLCFPHGSLSRLPAGDYRIQAIFAHSNDYSLPNAPGNLISKVVSANLDPAKGGVVKLVLDKALPPEKHPPETELVRYIKLRSELLSKFHGRDVELRAGVILPRTFKSQPESRYPLRVHISGFGGRYTGVSDQMRQGSGFYRLWMDEKTPQMVFLHLDGAGPLGDPYQVNSANNGPYGDAIVKELIPFVEKQYRCIGQPWARFTDGMSTGGWVSVALQIFYPDFFGGVWSHCPDPVDFRAYELINIYSDTNAYVNGSGFERPSCRAINGDTRYTVRHECMVERIMGRGGRWELSGKDWASWNAVFGPRGSDGLPRPLWDGATGKIDREVLDHWKNYDLRMVLEKNWASIGPKLNGKIHIWVGEADDYFLNNAVHLMDDYLRTAKPAIDYKITFAMGKNHFWRGLTELQMMQEMAAAAQRNGPRTGQ